MKTRYSHSPQQAGRQNVMVICVIMTFSSFRSVNMKNSYIFLYFHLGFSRWNQQKEPNIRRTNEWIWYIIMPSDVMRINSKGVVHKTQLLLFRRYGTGKTHQRCSSWILHLLFFIFKTFQQKNRKFISIFLFHFAFFFLHFQLICFDVLVFTLETWFTQLCFRWPRRYVRTWLKRAGLFFGAHLPLPTWIGSGIR